MCGKRAKGTSVIGLRFVSEAKIAELNRRYRDRNCATDVLSFSATEQGTEPFLEPECAAREQDLGDIVICTSVATREARRRAIDPAEELVRLVIHGTLHLIGHDHAKPGDEERMIGLQEQVLERVIV
jgi:probable rRNA maturation factor